MANNLNWLGSRMNESNAMERYNAPQQNMNTQQQMPPTQMQPATVQQPATMQPPMEQPTRNPQAAPMHTNQVPPVMDISYIQGYLTSIVGKNVRAEFMLGGSQYMDKAGRLLEVGVNYFVLEDFISQALIMCDLYSVKFVTTL